MAYDVATDHQIIELKKHRMQLLDRTNGKLLVDAKRDKDTGVWTVTVEIPTDPPIPAVTAPTVNGSPMPRSEVITAMVEQALAASPGTGYSTLVPHGLMEEP